MKKVFALILTLALILSLAACGGSAPAASQAAPASSAAAPASSEAAPAAAPESSAAPETPAAPAAAPGAIAPAENGTLTIGIGNAAIVVNGTAVPMPYKFMDLVAAGVPADESTKDAELGSGSFWTLNLYLDENEDYVVMPAYYNDTDSSITIADAGAGEISISTYSGEPVDQGVSILGVGFGTTKSEAKALLGEPSYESGDYAEWHVVVSDAAYEGTFYIYFASDSDDAGATQVDLSLVEQ